MSWTLIKCFNYSNHWFLAGFSFLPQETSLDLFRIFSVFQACFNPGWDSKADFKSLENSWNRSMDQQERSSPVWSSMWSHVLISLLAFSLAAALVLPPWCSSSSSDPLSCQFGSGRASCGAEQCLKGPGEVCGGPWHRSTVSFTFPNFLCHSSFLFLLHNNMLFQVLNRADRKGWIHLQVWKVCRRPHLLRLS